MKGAIEYHHAISLIILNFDELPFFHQHQNVYVVIRK